MINNCTYVGWVRRFMHFYNWKRIMKLMPDFYSLCWEDDESFQGVYTGKDMCGVPWNFIFYEICRIVFCLHHCSPFSSSKLYATSLEDVLCVECLVLIMHNSVQKVNGHCIVLMMWWNKKYNAFCCSAVLNKFEVCCAHYLIEN